MDKAIIFNTASQVSQTMTALEYERVFKGKPEEADLEAYSPKDGLPLTFRKSHSREGNAKLVTACWSRPPGFGDQDHIFDHEQQTLRQALRAGKKILLSLNVDLTSHSDLTFEGMKEKDSSDIGRWIGQNRGNYISIPIHNVQEAASVIKKISEFDGGKSPDDKVFALYRGAVVPYKHFYLGPRKQDISDLYDALQKRRAGVPIGETRIIGFPRMIRFIPTDSMQQEHGQRGLKGIHIQRQVGKPLFSSLVFEHHDQELKTPDYERLRDELSHEKGGVYIMACPSTTVGEDPTKWHQIRWVINDINKQTMPLPPEAKVRLHHGHGHDQTDQQIQHTPA